MLSLTAFFCAAVLAAHEPPVTPSTTTPGLEPATPRYVLDLTLEEFSVLHSAADHGVRTYGGHAAFKIDIFQSVQGPVWQIIIDEPKLLPVWSQWMAEKTAQLVSFTDIDQLGEGDKLAYRVTRSVNQKLKAAAEKPIYDSIRVSGTAVKLEDGTAGLKLEDGNVLRVIGRGASSLATAGAQEMMVDGTVKRPGEIDARGAFPRRPGVLEVFVLSLCPFGKSAEKAIIERLNQRSSGDASAKPAVEFRYLFIPTEDKTTFVCMHGEKELQENLVQMVIRDQFPSQFFSYLLARASSEAPWEQVAASAGLDTVAVEFIAGEIVRNREPLMAIEYAYWRERAVPMESPTYLWEGRIVKEPGSVPGMKGLTLVAGSCGGH